MNKTTKATLKKQLAGIAARRKKLVTPFKNDTPAKKRERVKRAQTDFEFFTSSYLPHYFTDATPDFHREWAEDAEIKNELVLLAAPRGFSKSTIFSLAKPLQWITCNQKHFIILGAQTGNQAEANTAYIKAELEQNERLIHDFGDLVGKTSWSDSDFTTKNNVRVKARGKGEALRGLKNGPHRPDAFIGDDLESDEEQENPRRIEKTMKWIREAVLPALNPAGWSAVIVGNILSRRSALSQLMGEINNETNTPIYSSRLYRAINEITGEPLWPERFPLDALEKLKTQMGASAFEKELNNRPRSDGDMFQEKFLAGWLNARRDPKNVTAIVLYTDPSVKEKSKNDFKATVALGNHEKYFDVLGARIRRESVLGMVTGAFDMYEALRSEYPAARVVMAFEANGFQELLRDDFYEEADKRGVSPRVIEIVNTAPKLVRIETLQSPFERGLLRFNQGEPDQKILLEQMYFVESGSVNDDGPDALAGAYAELKKLVRKRAGCYESVARRISRGYGRVLGSRVENGLAGVR